MQNVIHKHAAIHKTSLLREVGMVSMDEKVAQTVTDYILTLLEKPESKNQQHKQLQLANIVQSSNRQNLQHRLLPKFGCYI